MRRFFALLLAVCLGLALPGCREEAPQPSPSNSPDPVPTATTAPEAARFSLGYDPAATLHPITGTAR